MGNAPDVILAEERYKCEWGKGGIVYAIMTSLAKILNMWDTEYVVLLSESCYPVKSPEYIKNYLSKSNCDFACYQRFPHSEWLEGGMRRVNCYALHYGGKQVATIEPKKMNWGNARQFGKLLLQSPMSILKAIRMLLYPSRQKPKGIEWCGGDLWFIVKQETALAMVKYVQENPQILKEADLGVCMDEVVIPSLIEISSKGRQNRILTHVNWPKKQAKSPLFFLNTEKDRTIIKTCIDNPDLLFIRKISDPELQIFIDSNLKK